MNYINFFGKDLHVEFKCFKNMEALEATMKKHNINLHSSSKSYFHGMNIFSFGSSFNQSSSSCYNEWIVVYREYHHMDKDRYIFSSLNECNTKQIFVGGDRYLCVVEFGIN